MFDKNLYDYLCGWVISRGDLHLSDDKIDSISIELYNKEEIDLFERLCDIMDNYSLMEVYKVSDYYIKNFINILFGKDILQSKYVLKIYDVNIIKHYVQTKEYSKLFCRGYLEGCKVKLNINNNGINCIISDIDTISILKEYVEKYNGIYNEHTTTCIWYDTDALNFISDIYDRINLVDKQDSLLLQSNVDKIKDMRDLLIDRPLFIYTKVNKDAVTPYKKLVSSPGFNLGLIKYNVTDKEVMYYSTGIKITCDYGYYFEVHDNKLYKNGYVLATTSIINSPDGEIIIPIIKLNPFINDLVLPLHDAVQIIPKRIELVELVNYDYV